MIEDYRVGLFVFGAGIAFFGLFTMFLIDTLFTSFFILGIVVMISSPIITLIFETYGTWSEKEGCYILELQSDGSDSK